MSGLVAWAIFLVLSAIAIVTAGGMLVTMSMYRAGLALMSSFLALAGLFVLLDADLLAAVQVMMNVGGMLVMVLFMVMLMMDPGGEMMWDMKRKMHLPGPGAFSMRMPRGAAPSPTSPQPAMEGAEAKTDWTCPMHPEISEEGPGSCPKCGMDLVPRKDLEDDEAKGEEAGVFTCPMHPEIRQAGPGTCPKCGMDLVPAEPDDRQAHGQATEAPGGLAEPADGGMTTSMAMNSAGAGPDDDMATGESAGGDHQGMAMGHSGGAMAGMGGMDAGQHRQMMADMAMSTAQMPWALALGAASAVVLIVLVVRTAWPRAATGPTQDATVAVGELLLSRYMIGFEGAAFLILAGIAGAVIFATRDGEPPAPPKPPSLADREQQVYTCPMHPEVRQSGPGTCPKCGMDLVPADEPPDDTGTGHLEGGDKG